MYEKDALQVGDVSDSQSNYNSTFSAYLHHSCDEWVIGGPDQIKALIEDLTKALAQFPETPDQRHERIFA